MYLKIARKYSTSVNSFHLKRRKKKLTTGTSHLHVMLTRGCWHVSADTALLASSEGQSM